MNVAKLLIDLLGIGLEIYVVTLLYGTFWRMKPLPKRYYALGFCGFALVALIAIHFFHNQILHVIVYVVIVFLLGLYFENRLTSRLLLACLLVALFVASETAMGLALVRILSVSVEMTQSSLLSYTIGVLGSKLISLILVLILRFFIPPQDQDIGGRWFNLTTLILPFQSLILCFIIQRVVLAVDDASVMFFSTLALSISFLLIFVVVLVMRNQMKSIMYEHEYKLARYQLEAQIEHHKNLYAAQQEVRSLSHSINHELTALSGLLRAGKMQEALEYIEKTVPHIKTANDVAYTSSPVLNAILGVKIKTATERQVRLHHQILLNDDILIDQIDLAIVLGSALDNAIEAAVLCADMKRDIHLSITDKSGYLLIRVENFTPGEVKEVMGTTKPDKVNHGFGLRQMDLISSKYDGNLMTNYDKVMGKFSVKILLKNKST